MAIGDFREERFPEKIAFGFEGGPQFFTSVVATAGGFEQRNINWEVARARYNMAHEVKTQAELDELLNFFVSRRGRGEGFRFRDWNDFATDMPALITNPLPSTSSNVLPADGTMTHMAFGVGDGTDLTFQLTKTYSGGSGDDYVRLIKKPVAGAVRVYIDDVPQANPTDYSFSTTTGVVTFASAPLGGEILSWDGLFDVPVRFDSDEFSASLDHFNIHDWQGIGLVELRIPE